MNRSTFILLAGALAVAAVLAAGAKKRESSGPLLGLTINVAKGGGAQEIIDDVRMEQRLGINLMQTSVRWTDLEPSPGQFKLDKLRSDLANQKPLGFETIVTLQTIDTNNRAVPADLAKEPWDSPKMLDRERAFLKAVARVLPSGARALMLGNEVDVYFMIHPGEEAAYERFLAQGRKTMKAEKPDLDLGVTTTYSGLARDKAMIGRLQDGMDLVAMTYYPLDGGFNALPVADVASHFDEMTAFAGDRKLYIQEAGYPASELLGSSEKQQADFVGALFDAMAKHRSQLLGVCYFFLVDFDEDFLKKLQAYYGLSEPHFVAYLATIGLKKDDGSPRLAWDVFQKRADSFAHGG